MDSSTIAIETVSCWDSAYASAAAAIALASARVQGQLGAHSGLLLVVLSGEFQAAAKDPGEGSGKCAGIVAGDP